MNKISFILSLIIIQLVSSCNDLQENYLNSPTISSLDESVIFSSPDLAKGAVDGIKVPFAETNSYRGRFLPWYGLNTDVEWYNSSESLTDDRPDLCVYDAKTVNTQMNTANNAWAKMYEGIERANICIKGIRTFGNPEPGNEFGYLLGESLTLRAVYYADLLKTWGDVPARFEPINSSNIYLAKSNRDIIYKQIIQDLAEAATLVPWPNGSAATSNVERINKAFVKGLRARLALAASGFQQYPDGIRRSTDSELSVQNMYTLAFNECNDIIQSGSAQLEPSFENFWRKYNQENIAAGGESLWEIPFSSGRGRMLFTFAVRHNTNNQFQQNGANRGGQAGPLPFVFYDFDPADTRRNVTCVPYLFDNAVNGFSKQKLSTFSRWFFGKYRYEWMNRIVVSTNDDGVNKIYMRYAEILLMAAETANELNGPAAAAPYLKQLRMRAFPASLHTEKVDAYVDAIGSKSQMLDAIIKEHEFEFTGEMERKQALIRWNLLKTKLDEAKEKMVRLRDRTGEYANVPTTLYTKLNTDNVSLIIYGLNPGETEDQTANGYTPTVWTSLLDSKINSLYRIGVNPDERQFWPIWQVFIDASNGLLINDYGY